MDALLSLETLTHLIWDDPMINNDEWCLREYRSQWSVIWAAAAPDAFPALKTVVVQTYGLKDWQGTHNYIEEERLRSVQRTGPWDRGTVVEEQPRTTSRMLLQDLDSNNSL